MKDYLVIGKKDGQEYNIEIKAQNKKVAEYNLNKNGYSVVNIKEAKKAHVCLYCGNLVDGTNENLLCDECRELFGHTFFSQL